MLARPSTMSAFDLDEQPFPAVLTQRLAKRRRRRLLAGFDGLLFQNRHHGIRQRRVTQNRTPTINRRRYSGLRGCAMGPSQ